MFDWKPASEKFNIERNMFSCVYKFNFNIVGETYKKTLLEKYNTIIIQKKII